MWKQINKGSKTNKPEALLDLSSSKSKEAPAKSNGVTGWLTKYPDNINVYAQMQGG